MEQNYDFSGWATRNDLKCVDGRTIRRNAFKDCDGKTVPLVFNHDHDNLSNVIGHALLENRDDGVYCYGTLNDTEQGEMAKKCIKNGDLNSLSIYANNLKEEHGNVVHGVIREVSLVLAGANPGAYIDTILAHSEDSDELESAIIYHGEEFPLSLAHSEEGKEKESPEKGKEEMAAEEKKETNEKKTVQDVIDTMNEEQQAVMYGLIDEALKKGDSKDNDDKKEEEDTEMKHNVFENEENKDEVLIHTALNDAMKNAKQYGSLKDSVLAHTAEYGIENIEFINSEEKDIYDRPQFIENKPNGWVQRVISGVHHTPWAKVRMMFADITEDDARAKGYIKGKYKKEEVFKLLKRSVSPTTIYKKQKFDRDDLIDADFDVVPWIKAEMNLKFDEEKARAYIFGDGRSAADDDKINEANIIPVVSDEDLYTIKKTITLEQGQKIEDVIVDEAMLAMDDYQGSGNTLGFIDTKIVTKIRLLKDQFGHRLYKDDKEVAGAMGINDIVRVPSNILPNGTYGVILDLNDYNVGMKDAGKTNFFDDFDIDYNQQKYLMETRQSGALTRPYSAVVLKSNQG